MPSRQPLLKVTQRFFETDVRAAARSLEAMDENDALAVLRALPTGLVVETFRHLHPDHAAALLRDAPPSLVERLIARIEPHQVVALLMRLADEERRPLVDRMPEKQRRRVQELLAFPEDSAGRVMTTDFMAFRTTLRAHDAIERMRALASRRTVESYAYVVDDQERLAGILNMRDLVLARGDMPLASIMRSDVFTIDPFMDVERVATELGQRHFFAAPVVDAEGRLLGVVKTDSLLQQAQEEATEDLQRMFGAGGDERPFSSVVFSVRKRLPWLHVNLATAFLAAGVVALFEGVIARVTVLAVLLPIVAGQGGNAGAQSLAVVMRGLVMREIPPGRVVALLWKETLVGVGNGLVVGLVTAGACWLWQGNPILGLVIGLAMLANLIIASFAGAAIPLLMRSVGLDPAQSSNIVLTTVTDVMGFFSFLGLATLFERALT